MYYLVIQYSPSAPDNKILKALEGGFKIINTSSTKDVVVYVLEREDR
jgi:hypothetical protein